MSRYRAIAVESEEGIVYVNLDDIFNEHFNNGNYPDNYIIEYGFITKILPLTGLILQNKNVKSDLHQYPYCPDERLYIIRRLSRHSPGLPPPSHSS